jgi:protein-S-isoprenylcysteine O-methyltransferase Ste14
MKRQEKPRGLLPVVLILCLLNFTDMFTANSADPDYAASRGVNYFFIALYYLVIWWLWNGSNAARIGVLVFSVLSLFGVLFWNQYTPAEQVTTVAWAILSAFLLYWLNTKPVKEYFKPVQPVAPHDSSLPPIPEP